MDVLIKTVMQNAKDITGLRNPSKNPTNDPKFLKELFKDITRDVDEIKDKFNDSKRRQEVLIKENLEMKDKVKLLEGMILTNVGKFNSYVTTKESLERFKEVDKRISGMRDEFDSFKLLSISGMNNSSKDSGGGGASLEVQKQLLALQQTEQSGRYVSLQSFQDFKSLYYSQMNKHSNEIEEK